MGNLVAVDFMGKIVDRRSSKIIGNLAIGDDLWSVVDHRGFDLEVAVIDLDADLMALDGDVASVNGADLVDVEDGLVLCGFSHGSPWQCHREG